MAPVADLRVRLFGGFDVQRHGTSVEGLRAREAGRLLAFLVLAGRPVASTSVASTFWPATGSLDSLRQSVRQARKVLGSDGERLDLSEGMIAFCTEGMDVDVLAFDRLAARGDSESLRLAADLYTGPLLEDWDEGWVIKERERRRERCADIQRRLAQEALNAGSPDIATERLRACVRLKPSEERVWRDLMQAQMLAGERVAALETYERYRAYLNRHGGLKPPPETTALYQTLREEAASPKTPPSDPTREPVGGAVPLDSYFYVARPADGLFCPAIARQSSLVLVKGPRQSGKSSLLARGLQSARRAGAVTAVTDFESIVPQDLETMDALCLRLAAQLASQLDLEIAPESVWRPLLGPGANLERFLIRYVLEDVAAPIVWAMDGVDRLFSLAYGSEFFSLLRAWHEKRALEPFRPWGRLTVALACATEAHLYIRDLNKSPFNVGTRVELTDFTREQVAQLNRRYRGLLETDKDLEKFYDLVGGHPYLVRRGLHEMGVRGASLTDLLARATGEDGPFGDHLHRLLRCLTDDPELATATREALHGKPCPPASFFRLRSAGVLVGDPAGAVRPRCRLYAEYLEDRL